MNLEIHLQTLYFYTLRVWKWVWNLLRDVEIVLGLIEKRALRDKLLKEI